MKTPQKTAGPLLFLLAVTLSCSETPTEFRDLEPYPNRGEELSQRSEPQPPREHPLALALSPDGSRLFVAMQGSVDEPGTAVQEMDAETLRPTQRHKVGSGPTRLAMHPDGRYVVVTNRFSNYLSVIDAENATVSNVPADFYAIGARFSPDGNRLYVTNRWRDALQVWDASVEGDELVLHPVATAHSGGVPVGSNPNDVVTSADGETIFVAAMGGLTISQIDANTLREVERVDVGAPVNDLVAWKDHIFVATLSASTHHPATEGPDTDGDGQPGDGTANEDFRDLQNELAVYEALGLAPVHRYTSDTICCRDSRDVAPDDPMLGEYLADQSTWIVGGALPERVAVAQDGGDPVLIVVYSGSNEVQRFAIDPRTAALEPGPKAATGFNPSGLVVDSERGRVYVSNRLGESITVLELSSFRVIDTVVVGDVSEGEFPATNAELGEFYFFAGAEFSVDGDQTCSHCHREQGNIGKTFSMPLLADSRGSRMMPAARGMVATRPWFIEGGMDESNMGVVINEFARGDNFCCNIVASEDPYTTNDASTQACLANPPPECADRPWPRSFASRNVFFADAARRTLGRDVTFGGRLGIAGSFSFESLTNLIGTYLVQEPALLPNPNPPDAPDAVRGRQIFNSAGAGCAACHPAPSFTVTAENSPAGTPIMFPPVITPNRSEDGKVNLDLLQMGFLDTFPEALQYNGDLFTNAPTLLGIWDRSPPFLHDGRARNLREALSTPGHPALLEGERGFNELNGIPDTHGGTSHLSAEDIADLITYLESL